MRFSWITAAVAASLTQEALAGPTLGLNPPAQNACSSLSLSSKLILYEELWYGLSKKNGKQKLLSMCDCLERNPSKTSRCNLPKDLYGKQTGAARLKTCPCLRKLWSSTGTVTSTTTSTATTATALTATTQTSLTTTSSSASMSTSSSSITTGLSTSTFPSTTTTSLSIDSTSVASTSTSTSETPTSTTTTLTTSSTTSSPSSTSTSTTTTLVPETMPGDPMSGITTITVGTSTFIVPTDAAGTESTFDGPYILAAAPTATLKPVTPYGIDTGSLDRVTPATTNQLMYHAPATDDIPGTLASLSITYQYPAVALDQSYYISNVECSGGTVKSVFNDTGIYNYAASLWKNYPQILFITAAPSCDPDGQNVFILAGQVVCDDKSHSCAATGVVKELGDVFENLDAEWGDVTPPTSSPSDSPTTSPSACGSPPSASISGLPAAACGSDFDKNLDDIIGYYSGSMDDDSAQAVLAEIAPTSVNSRLMRRWSFKSVFNKVASVVKAVAAPVAKAVVNTVKSVATMAVNFAVKAATNYINNVITIAKTVYNVAKFIVTGDYNQTFTFKSDIGPPAELLTKSPWNDDALGFKFYHWAVDKKDRGYKIWDNMIDLVADQLGKEAKPEPGVDFWCVDCGIRGKLAATGILSANLKGISKAQIKLQGSMYAGVFLGVEAFATVGKKFEQTLLKQGLPGFSIPKIFTIGPSLSLGVSAEARVELLGRALAGASLNWPSIEGVIDFYDKSKSSAKGFAPVFNGTLQTSQSAKLILSLGMPAAVNFGVDLLNGKYKKDASLTDTPAIVGVLERNEQQIITGSTDNGGCAIVNNTPANGCHGVGWNISLVNDVELNLFDYAKFNLFHWEQKNPIAKGCVGTKSTPADVYDSCSNETATTTKPAPVTITSIPTCLANYTGGARVANAAGSGTDSTRGNCGRPQIGGVSWYPMASGQGYVERVNNPGNWNGNPLRFNFPAQLEQNSDLPTLDSQCSVIHSCAQSCYDAGYQDSSFDIHFFCNAKQWECVCYVGYQYYGDYFSEPNDQVAYFQGWSGYTLG